MGRPAPSAILSPPDQLIELGKVVNRHGVRGTLRVLLHNPLSATADTLTQIALIGTDGSATTTPCVCNWRFVSTLGCVSDLATDFAALVACGYLPSAHAVSAEMAMPSQSACPANRYAIRSWSIMAVVP